MRQTEVDSVVWECYFGETTSGLYDVVCTRCMVGEPCDRLDSSPVLVREILKNHIRLQNVAIVVPRIARHRGARLGDANIAKVV